MPTIQNAATRASIHARLDRLRPELKPAWGRMSAAQMLAHLTDAFKMAVGELPVAPKNRPIMRTWFFKRLFFTVIPFPKSAPTATELVSRVPDAWSDELATLKVWLDRVGMPSPTQRWAAHPLFGTLSGQEWGVLAHKHMDHHLRQFGV
jgi:Protein of unknown function (DUF1569)